jgi:hypothetical protein
VPIGAVSTHVSLRFKSIAPTLDNQPAKLGSAVLHHAMTDDED